MAILSHCAIGRCRDVVCRGTHACIVAGAAFIAYSKGWFGSFDHPSFLPGAAIFFAIGAVTRIAINELPKVTSYPLGLGIICLAATYNTAPPNV